MMFCLWSSLVFLPFFGLIGVLADDTGCAEAGDTCILEVRSLNVVLLPDLPSQEHCTNAGEEASQQSIENTRFSNPFGSFVGITWEAAENATTRSTAIWSTHAGAETMFPFFCHLWNDISQRVNKSQPLSSKSQC